MRVERKSAGIILTILIAICIIFGATAEEAKNPLDLPAYTLTECEWDEAGKLVSETAHDTEGNPAVNNRGFYRAEYTYGESGQLASEAYFGLNGEAVVATDVGYAKVEYAYDELGHLIAEDRYTTDGSRAEIPGSYSYRRDTYDGEQILASEYFDATENPVQPTGGYAKILYDVQEDDNSIVISKTYEDAEGKPLIGSEGGAKVIYIYAKNLTAAVNAKVDNMGLGMLLPAGEAGEYLPAEAPVSESGALYDDEAHHYGEERKPMLLSTEIYGTKDEETLGAKRWHREVRSYDAHGNLTRTDYYDNDGTPIIAATGCASVVNTYDELDRVIQIDYLDKEGNLLKMINGYARVTYEYYEGNERVHYERFFGADGERTMITRGMSMIEYEYNGGEWDYRETYYDI